MIDSWDSTPEDLREFLIAEKACPVPAPEVQSRVFERLAGSIGLAAGTTAASLPSPTSAAPPSSGASLARVAAHLTRRSVTTFLIGAALGAATMGAVDRLRPRPMVPPAPVVPSTPTPVSPAPRPAPVPAAESPVAPPAAPSPVGRRPAPSYEPRDKRLEAERKLVEMARTSLARGQNEAALAALRRHLRLYATGELAEERDSLWISVLVARGDYAQARSWAARFHRRYPSSLFGPMVDQAVKSIP